MKAKTIVDHAAREFNRNLHESLNEIRQNTIQYPNSIVSSMKSIQKKINEVEDLRLELGDSSAGQMILGPDGEIEFHPTETQIKTPHGPILVSKSLFDNEEERKRFKRSMNQPSYIEFVGGPPGPRITHSILDFS